MFEYKGQSLRQYCLENNINYFRIYGRIKKKCMSVEEAIKLPKISQVIYKDKQGNSLRSLCKTQSEYVIRLRRMRNYGVSVEDSSKKRDLGDACAKHFFNGISFRKICNGDENRYRRALRRLRQGHSKQVALFGTKWDVLYG